MQVPNIPEDVKDEQQLSTHLQNVNIVLDDIGKTISQEIAKTNVIIDQKVENINTIFGANSTVYSEYYIVSSLRQNPNHGELNYLTGTNKLYKYNATSGQWVEVNWAEIVKATPDWIHGRLRIQDGVLQTTRYGGTWTTVYPVFGAKRVKIMDKTKLYYAHKTELDYGIWVGVSGHNVGAILYKGKLYTTSGNNSSNWNTTTGRGLNGQNPFYGVHNFKRVQLPTDDPIVKVGGFVYSYAFALTASGKLYTWGHNNNGQCGSGNTNPIATPTLVQTGVLDVYWHPTQGSCAVDQNRLFILKSDGLYACGYNANGNLGIGNTNNPITQFTKCTVFTSASQIKKVFPFGCNGGFNFVLTTDGKIYFSGYNVNSVAGLNSTSPIATFTDVTNAWAGVSSGVQDIEVVAGGSNYNVSNLTAYYNTWAVMLITLPNGSKILRSCGFNDGGQLGDGTFTTRATPVNVIQVNANNVIKLRANGNNGATVHALCSNGDLYGWGYNGCGAVGDGTINPRATPQVVATGVKDIFMNGQSSHINNQFYQTFIAKEDGLYACGANDHGYCGLGHTTTPVTSFTKVKLELDVDEYVTDMGCYSQEGAGYVIIAVTSKNRFFAWGFNGRNGITANSTINCLTPVQFTIQE